MKKEQGITLIALIMTVMLLIIITGLVVTNSMDTYEESRVIKFETYMKIIQKKVDVLIEENSDYRSLGTALTDEQENRLLTIITDNNSIRTNGITEDIRYFSATDIKAIFEISDINDEIVINFGNREVISLNGIEKDGVMHYVESGLY